MSIGTIAQELIDDSHSLIDEDAAYRKIISAARYHRDQRLYVSEREFRLPLVAGQAAYDRNDTGFPQPLAQIAGNTLFVLIGGSEDNKFGIGRLPAPDFDFLRTAGASRSQPEVWNFHNLQLRFYPTPSSSTDIVYGRYMQSIDVPIVRYEGGAWAYYAPDGVTLLTSTEIAEFTSDWFAQEGGGPIIKTRAAYLIYKEYLHDGDMANDALQQWLEAVGQGEVETEQLTSGDQGIMPSDEF